MKAYLKRNNMYYKKYLGLGVNQISWVEDINEAKLFNSVKEAREEIKKYKIKNVDLVKRKGIYEK